MNRLPNPVYRWFFTVTFIEWMAVLVIFCVIFIAPGLSKGFSSIRLRIIISLVGLSAGMAWFVTGWWRNSAWSQNLAGWLTSKITNHRVYWTIIACMGVPFLLGMYFTFAHILLVRSRLENLYVAPYLEFSWLFALLGSILAIETVVVMRLIRFGTDIKVFRPYRRTYRAVLVVFGSLVLIIALMGVTRLGLKPDRVGWGAPGVPILHTQVLIATLITSAAFGLAFIVGEHLGHAGKLIGLLSRSWVVDALVCIGLWGLAIWVWGSQPLQASFFSPAPLPPNYEFYPNSDSISYDLAAQRLLLGFGFERDAIRPLYVMFLAIAHAVSGIGYQSVIGWQIVSFAILPVLMYLLGKALHVRFSGVLAGLLVIIHERNAIALAGEINTAHAKLLLADLPTTISLLAFTLVVVLWMQKPRSNRVLPVVAGGTLALAMLIRTQVVVLLPILLILTIVYFWRRPFQWLANGLLIVGSMLFVLTPWLWRTYQVTGWLGLPEMTNPTQANVIGERYSLDLHSDLGPRKVGETEAEYLSRLRGGTLDFILANPELVAGFILNHFFHNQVSTALVLPASFDVIPDIQGFDKVLSKWSQEPGEVWERCCSLRTYVRVLPFWKAWDGVLDFYLFIPILIALFLLAIGIGVSWSQWGLVGLIPLVINIGYSLGNGLVRNSGWRYNLPVDWVGILYYSIGLAQLLFWVLAYLANRLIPRGGAGLPQPGEELYYRERFPWKVAIPIALAFFAVSATLPVMERAIPNRYANMSLEHVLTSLEEQGWLGQTGLTRSEIQSYLGQEGAVALIGRGLYPRFFDAHRGENETGWPERVPTDVSRLGFHLAGEERAFIFLPMNEAPSYFPNASDVLVLGCLEARYILADRVVILADPSIALPDSHAPLASCSPATQTE